MKEKFKKLILEMIDRESRTLDRPVSLYEDLRDEMTEILAFWESDTTQPKAEEPAAAPGKTLNLNAAIEMPALAWLRTENSKNEFERFQQISAESRERFLHFFTLHKERIPKDLTDASDDLVIFHEQQHRRIKALRQAIESIK